MLRHFVKVERTTGRASPGESSANLACLAILQEPNDVTPARLSISRRAGHVRRQSPLVLSTADHSARLRVVFELPATLRLADQSDGPSTPLAEHPAPEETR